jgi:hypothetical protein
MFGIMWIRLLIALIAMIAFAIFRAARAGMIEKFGDVFSIGIPAYALGLAASEGDWNASGQFVMSYIGA